MLKKTSRTAAWCLYSTIAVVLLTVGFYYLSDYRFYISNYAFRWMTIGCTLLAVLVVAAQLLTLRKTPQRMRQLATIDEKLAAYHTQVRNIYTTSLATVVLECVAITLMHNNTLLMLVLIVVLMLFFAYPNSLRVKTDLSLTDEEMKSLE